MISDGLKLGELSLPKVMVDDMGWDNIKAKVLRAFQLFIPFQPNETLCWQIAVHQVYADWHGVYSFMQEHKM